MPFDKIILDNMDSPNGIKTVGSSVKVLFFELVQIFMFMKIWPIIFLFGLTL